MLVLCRTAIWVEPSQYGKPSTRPVAKIEKGGHKEWALNLKCNLHQWISPKEWIWLSIGKELWSCAANSCTVILCNYQPCINTIPQVPQACTEYVPICPSIMDEPLRTCHGPHMHRCLTVNQSRYLHLRVRVKCDCSPDNVNTENPKNRNLHGSNHQPRA